MRKLGVPNAWDVCKLSSRQQRMPDAEIEIQTTFHAGRAFKDYSFTGNDSKASIYPSILHMSIGDERPMARASISFRPQ